MMIGIRKGKNQFIIICISLLIVLLSGVYFYFFISVNRRYPEAEAEVHSIDEAFVYAFNKNFEFKVGDFSILNKEEIEKLDPVLYQQYIPAGSDVVLCLVTLNIKNIGKEVDSLEIAPFKIESGVYENGFELNFYGYFNKDGKKGDYASGEERVFVLPYLVFRAGLKEKNWENRYGLKCFLVTSLYPVEQRVMLN